MRDNRPANSAIRRNDTRTRPRARPCLTDPPALLLPTRALGMVPLHRSRSRPDPRAALRTTRRAEAGSRARSRNPGKVGHECRRAHRRRPRAPVAVRARPARSSPSRSRHPRPAPRWRPRWWRRSRRTESSAPPRARQRQSPDRCLAPLLRTTPEHGPRTLRCGRFTGALSRARQGFRPSRSATPQDLIARRFGMPNGPVDHRTPPPRHVAADRSGRSTSRSESTRRLVRTRRPARPGGGNPRSCRAHHTIGARLA
jgi:hypothetical protein